ncbi:MAG: ABC transporter substrate-binding protein [Betaproteobacteria bacterium]|nr:ABC transporter substrate-binding protein [Betaproteobacteria bacterium]
MQTISGPFRPFRLLATLALALAAATFGLGTATAQPSKRGGTLILGVEGEPGSLTAHLATDTAAMMVAYNIFNGLIGLDEKLDPTPDLAEKWSVSPDGKVYTFELAKNAKWHDGKPVTADDAEYSFNEIIAKVHPRAGSWWPNVASAKATGPHTFVITLKAPYAPFLTLVASVLSSGTLILPKHIYVGTDPKTNPANQKPIGSGPFKFAKWERGSFVELSRNDDYFKAGKPYLDRLVFKIMPDASARLLAFERGEVDFLHWYIVPYDQVAKLRKDARFQLIEKGDAAATNGLLLMNHRNQYLKDVRVRRAIAHAVDRADIAKKALFGEAKVAKSHVGSGLAWIYTDKFDYAFDPAKANQLLDEAGFKRGADGKRFALRIHWASGRDYEGRAAEIIKDNLRAVGIDVTVLVLDRPSFIDKVFRNWDFDLANQLFTTGPDPSISVTPRYHTNQIKKAPFVNGMGYTNPEVDKLFDAEFTEVDRTKRAAMWRAIQQHLMADLPALPLFEVPPIHAASAKYRDIVTGSQGYIESRENAYMVR